jgi:hypothetical protein
VTQDDLVMATVWLVGREDVSDTNMVGDLRRLQDVTVKIFYIHHHMQEDYHMLRFWWLSGVMLM